MMTAQAVLCEWALGLGMFPSLRRKAEKPLAVLGQDES